MSVYLYGFKPKPRKVEWDLATHDVFELSFRRGNAQDEGPIQRIIDRLERQWEDHDLSKVIHYVQGKFEEGSYVYVTTDLIKQPFWFDDYDLPGKPVVVGSLTKRNGRWRVNPFFDVQRRDADRSGRCVRIQNAGHWRVTGACALDYESAVRVSRQLNNAAETGSLPYYYEVVASNHGQ